MTTSYIYGTADNNGGTILSFGSAGTSETSNTSPAVAVGTRASDADSSSKVYTSGGTLNYYGQVQVFGQSALLNNKTANPKHGTYHADRIRESQIGRHFKISTINYVTGAVTWAANVGDSYVMVASTGTTYVDNVYSSTNSPYAVPGHLTYLGDLSPNAVSYRSK